MDSQLRDGHNVPDRREIDLGSANDLAPGNNETDPECRQEPSLWRTGVFPDNPVDFFLHHRGKLKFPFCHLTSPKQDVVIHADRSEGEGKQDNEEMDSFSNQREAVQLAKEGHEAHPSHEVGNKDTKGKRDPIKKDLPTFLSHKSEVRNQEDDRGKGAGIDAIDEPSNQDGREAPSFESFNDALISLFQGFPVDHLPWG